MLISTRHLRISALLAAMIFVAMQVYALHMSTFHALHDIPPMCELCAMAKNSDNGLVASLVSKIQYLKHEHNSEHASSTVYLSFNSPYQTRAPPRPIFIS